MLSELYRPFSYLHISHPKKWLVDWLYPTLLMLISFVILWFTTRLNGVASDTGIVSRVFVFTVVLPGFFIAALAAIATFNRQDIDQLMPEPTPKFDVEIGGKQNVIGLTRRRFLAMLFAFLCAESLVLCVICALVLSIHSNSILKLESSILILIKSVIAIVVLELFWQMIVTTMFGLYYLGFRLLWPDLNLNK